MIHGRTRQIGVLALALTALGGGASAAQGFPTGGIETKDYRILTDVTNSNLNTGDFKMPRTVRFSRPGTDATANSAQGNFKRGTATLTGNVVLHDSGNADEGGSTPYHGNGPATLTCDQLDVDSKAKLYTASGHVRFNQGTQAGTADKAILNRANQMLHLEGNVHLDSQGSTLSANMVDYNLNTKDVEVHGSPAVMSQPANQPPAPSASASSPKPGPKPKTTPRPKPKATGKP
ncbi:MAG TPA: LptA/OstA family protein [Candidatus Elarobacter sp.]|jgi:lipopolysaccharide export system protein LptA